MKIIIIANFCLSFSESDNNRFLYIAKILHSNGHNVEIITSNFYHIEKRHRDILKINFPFKVTFIDEPGYPKNVCIKRFYSHFIWGINVEKYLKIQDKPDVIYCAVPSLTAPNIVAKYCKENNIRFIIDIQDLWPEAFRKIFNIPIISNFLFSPFRFLANNIYKSADTIITVSETYAKKVSRYKKAIIVFLGTDLNIFDRYASGDAVLKKEPGDIWIGYCGTLGLSYDIDTALSALNEIYSSGVKSLKFIVMGDGPDKNRLQKESNKLSIDIIFTGFLAYDKMCATLKRCDILINPLKSGVAQSIINKHADYAASGLPVINTQDGDEYRKLVSKYNMGINCAPEDKRDLKEKIMRLINDKDARIQMGKNARKCAEEKFDRKINYRIILKAIENR